MSSHVPESPKARITQSILAAVIFVAIYLAIAVIGALRTGNSEFVFYIAVMGVLIVMIWIVHWRVGLTPGVIWALAIWGGLHMAGGLVPVPESWPINGDIRVLYSWWIIPKTGGGGWLKYDQVVHAFGFAVTTWVCWQALRGAVGRIQPTFGIVVLCAAAGLGFSALNEVVEFAAYLRDCKEIN